MLPGSAKLGASLGMASRMRRATSGPVPPSTSRERRSSVEVRAETGVVAVELREDRDEGPIPYA